MSLNEILASGGALLLFLTLVQITPIKVIEIWNNEDGPIARITVCITGSGLAEDETVIDTNNCPWAMEFIKQHGFGQATGRMVKSGYCTYPVVKLDIEKIGEYLEVA